MSSPSSSASGPSALRMETWLWEGLAKREFLQRLDSQRDVVFEALEAAYGDAYYAKLLYLKASNYALARYHYSQSHSALVSGPVSLMIDAANSCQLRCPGCVHSENARFTEPFLWPPGVMKSTAFVHLLERYGPTATNTVLYNYGEPLLNKKLPDFILAARQLGLTTNLSTNLSIDFDTERFVSSQPDHVILSIDGITQETYGRYRKRGDLDLVLRNVRALVKAKRDLGLNRPILMWRFFPFEHNVHEVEDAIELAREIGVDQIVIGKPFAVENDDPGIRLTECTRSGRYDFTPAEELERRPESILAGLAPHPQVDALFSRGWVAQGEGRELDEPGRKAGDPCTWLYFSLTADAADRVMPCCITPTKKRDLVYGSLAEEGADLFNSPHFQLSRLGLSDRGDYGKRLRANEVKAPPYCPRCPRRPPLTSDPQTGIADLGGLDFKKVLLDLGEKGTWDLANWEA